LKFAYADPPYPGQAHKYKDHPDYAGEVDHAELINRLCRDYPDGWALSTNARSVQYILGLCPLDVRMAVWNVTSQPPPGGAPGWWWCWEPVIVRGGRLRPVSSVLTCSVDGSNHRFVGAKPAVFTRWMLELIGAEPEDTIDDLFPGSGAVARTIESWRRQPVLPVFIRPAIASHRSHRDRLQRDSRLTGHPTLD
jgi:hypothetical protein